MLRSRMPSSEESRSLSGRSLRQRTHVLQGFAIVVISFGKWGRDTVVSVHAFRELSSDLDKQSPRSLVGDFSANIFQVLPRTQLG